MVSFPRTIALAELVGQWMLAPARNSHAPGSMSPLCPRDLSTPCQLRPRASHLRVCCPEAWLHFIKRSEDPGSPYQSTSQPTTLETGRPNNLSLKPGFQGFPYFLTSRNDVRQVMLLTSQAANQENDFPMKTNKSN